MQAIRLEPIASNSALKSIQAGQSQANSRSLRLIADSNNQLAFAGDPGGINAGAAAGTSGLNLTECPACADSHAQSSTPPRVIGDLFFQASRASWFLALSDPSCGINHQTPPLELAKLEPGALLSVGGQFWHVATVFTPEPFDAPAELAAKPCPVCGAPLGEAPVVQCFCGRFSHLEKPAAPDDADALNCFLAVGVCGGCHEPTSLEPQVSPALPLCLADWASDEDLELQIGAV